MVLLLPFPLFELIRIRFEFIFRRKSLKQAIATNRNALTALAHYMRQNEWIFQRTAAIGPAQRDE